ncbi:MAG: metalloregulator ArsR/SmtB family transcription factor [Verrucomicrobia bacterium]|jgi:rhodanese-related sulfurtransferase|nr:metalloregulator ArsR/SmtB family transcription factor [Verrucomicrobiota bacterium]
MKTDDPQAPFDLIATLGHVLASPHRLRLLHLLCQCDRTVEDLAEVMQQPVANVSHHLQLLKKANLVATRRLGRHVAYGIADESVKTFWLQYRDYSATRLAELQQLYAGLAAQRSQRGGTISREALADLLQKGSVVLVDVRPREEYDADHLPGAISIPLGELIERVGELPQDKLVVLYCRGPYCLLGDNAQQQLAARSIRALRLNEGVKDWAAAGLPHSRSPGHQPLVQSRPA